MTIETIQNTENYFDVGTWDEPVMSNSGLGALNPNQGGSILRLRKFFEKDDEKREASHHLKGRIVHKYMEDPSNFAVEPSDKPSDAVSDIVEYIYSSAEELTDMGDLDGQHLKQVILEACNVWDYQRRWHDETRVKKIVEEGATYWTFLKENQGKLIMQPAIRDAVLGMIASMEANQAFGNVLEGRGMTKEIPIYFEYDNVSCKALLDMLFLDKERKIAVINDLKTTGKPASQFMGYFTYEPTTESLHLPIKIARSGAFSSFRYYRQLAFYEFATRHLIRGLGYDPNEWDYRFNVYVVESQDPYESMVYPVGQDWINVGKIEIADIMLHYQDYRTHWKLDEF